MLPIACVFTVLKKLSRYTGESVGILRLCGNSDLKCIGPSMHKAMQAQRDCRIEGALWSAARLSPCMGYGGPLSLSLRLHLKPFHICFFLHCAVLWSEWGQGPLSIKEALLTGV